MKPIYGILLLLLLFPSCLWRPRLEGKVWNLVETSSDSEPIGFLRFYQNVFTGRIEGVFRYGAWQLHHDTLVLRQGDSLLWFKASMAPGALTLQTLDEGGLGVALHFEPGPVIDDPAKDAYSLQNNTWEIKARGQETDDQILGRVKAHLRCEELYVEKAIETDQETISTSVFPSPIGFYGNGLALEPLNRVPDAWKDTFFDTTDMYKGYQVLRNAFSANIAIPDTKKRFVLYHSILTQLYHKCQK